MKPSILRFRPGVTLPSRAYLDVNLLIDARDQLSSRYRAASTCLRELIWQRVELNISTLVFDELWWTLFKSSYRRLTSRREFTGQEYKHNIEIWRAHWPIVRRATEEILQWGGLNVLESAPAAAVLQDAMQLLDLNPLAPRDAFHLAIALRHRIPSIVTADRDFDRIELPHGTSLTIVRF